MYTIEEFDKAKSKVLKYILYKKRTKQEVKNKFYNTIEQEMLNDIIENLEENGYINDSQYITRAIAEFKALNNLSIKEVKNKLALKGISNNIIDDYITNNKEEMAEYELESAKKIIIKKINIMDKDEIKNYLLKKGYMKEIISEAFSEIE